MPAWIHDRAMSMKKDMEKTYGPEKAKQVAFAVATQQAHKVGKSPKTHVSKETGKKEAFGTPEGRAEAKVKFDKPKSEYKKTAAFESHIPRGERLKGAIKETLKDKRFRLAMAIGVPVTALTAGGIAYARHKGKKKTASAIMFDGFFDELAKIAAAKLNPEEARAAVRTAYDALVRATRGGAKKAMTGPSRKGTLGAAGGLGRWEPGPALASG
jgi:hypothetical protein